MNKDLVFLVAFVMLIVFIGIQMSIMQDQIDVLGNTLSEQLEELQEMKDGGS